MNLHQLRVFCEVAETGSFSVASERLYLTQPAVTLQIKNLEVLPNKVFRKNREKDAAHGGREGTPRYCHSGS